MPITTIKRIQNNPEWWFTVEDCNPEDENSQTGITITYYERRSPNEGRQMLSMDKADTLLLRDALNQLYPPDS